MNRKKKNKGLYLKELILKVFDYVGLVKKIIKLNKRIKKLEKLNRELEENNNFLFDENSMLKTQLLIREVGEK